MKRADALLTLAVVLAAGCSKAAVTQPAAVDNDVQGDWEQDYGTTVHPGNSLFLSLSESGGRVAGTGTYTIEAGAPGAISVSGTVARDSLRLVIIFVPDSAEAPLARPENATFVGALASRDRIDGSLIVNNSATMFNLLRRSTASP
jgi:hypothetical protein